MKIILIYDSPITEAVKAFFAVRIWFCVLEQNPILQNPS